MDPQEMKRQQKLLALADTLLEKLTARVEAADPMELNPQTMKHITGVMKDLKDIQSGVSGTASGQITVIFEGDLEDYSA